MAFVEYEKTLRKMGVNSGAYRDLDLSFVRHDGQLLDASGAFNLVSGAGDPAQSGLKRLHTHEMLSAAVAYLGTYLHRRGFSFDYVNAFQDQKEVLADKLQSRDITAIAITTTLYVSVFPILEIIEFVRQYNSDAKIIVGGPFVSTQARSNNPRELEYLLKSIGADVYVDSAQGEATLVKVLSALKAGDSMEGIENIYYKEGDGYHTAPKLREDNLLSDNMVDWSLLGESVGEYANARTAISCPFSCSFCGFPEHAGKYQTAEIGAVIGELKSLYDTGSVKMVHFIDDTFNVPKKRFKDLMLAMIESRLPLQWTCHFRCQFADRDMVELMKKSGCVGVFLGLESGNDQILRNMNKATDVARYRRGIELLKEFGILTYGSFIVGFPGETEETVMDSVRLIEETGIDFYRTQLWFYEAITPIASQKETYGIKGSNFEWRHNTMDSRQAADLIESIFLSVDRSVWLPQQNFDFINVFHITSQGIDIDRVKRFVRAFNSGVKEKICNRAQQELSTSAFQRLSRSLDPDTQQDTATAGGGELSFDFNLD
jgi:radical SAM PhpK family P-methyltransferase